MKALLTLLVCVPLLRGAAFHTISNNQMIVWIGDSIYHPVQASAYVESYFYFNYPTNQLRFRNVCYPGSDIVHDWALGPAAVGGPHLAQRWALPWKPNVIFSVTGNNDIDLNNWQTNYTWLLPNFITASNALLNGITNTGILDVESVAGYSYFGCNLCMYHAPWLSQITNLVAQGIVNEFAQTWTNIMPYWTNEVQNALNPPITNLFFAAWDNHPTPASELLLAWNILYELGYPTNISSAAINAATGASNVVDCLVSNVVTTATNVTFQRFDFKLPMAWDQTSVSNDSTKDSYIWTNLFIYAPQIIESQRHMIIVSNLAAGDYTLSIDGSNLVTLSSAQLSAGYNLTWLNRGSYWTQRLHMINLIREKEGRIWTTPKTDNTEPARRGVAAFKVASNTEWFNNGLTGTNLINALQDDVAATMPYDTNIWNAAVGQWRSFSISLAALSGPPPDTGPLSGKSTLVGKAALQ